MRTNWTTVAAACLVMGTCAGGNPPKSDADVARLVRDLGSPRFAVREAAERKLVELGPKAKAAVLAGTKDPDYEVARRCEVVLPKIQAVERKVLLDGAWDWPAPEGRVFKELVGDTKESRALYAEMTGDDRRAGLAAKAAAYPAGAARLYWAEVTRLAATDSMAGARRKGFGPASRDASLRAAPPEEVILALFLGAVPPADGSPDPAQVACVLRAGFSDLVAGPQKEPFRKLFATWLAHRSEPTAVAAGLEAALSNGLAGAVPVARRWVTDSKASARVAGMAALVLGTHGSTDDLTPLTALRADTRLYRGMPGTGSEVQVRDVAAGMSLVLRGQDIRAFGFQLIHVRAAWGKSGDPCPYMDVSWVGLPADREAGHKKAREWLDQQAGAPAKPGK